MGRDTFTRAAYERSYETFVPKSGPATRLAEQRAHSTGKLNPLIDPAEYNVIRRSLVRLEQRPDGLWEMTVGCSMPVETRVDTTGSMGGNVDIALKALGDLYVLCGDQLPGYDLHIATGIFGDIVDNFPLCRPQFEMLPDKIVEQLTLMVPERDGGDAAEDPHYGIFGGAFLVAAYANCIGLKRYDFTVSDAVAHDYLSERQLKRIFGTDVFDKVRENGFDVDHHDLPTNKEVVQALLDQAHGFFLQVGDNPRTKQFWTNLYGPDRVVVLPDTRLLPQVQATIIGLTEGTLSLGEVRDFLRENNVSDRDAKRIEQSVANIPLGAQVPLREHIRVPQQGDLFVAKPDVFKKTNLWPIDASEAPAPVTVPADDTEDNGPTWL